MRTLKWLMSGAAIAMAGLLISNLVPVLDPTATAVGVGVVLPVCLGVAILKYRLYDIDRIISRTLAYTIVTGLLIGLYAGLVLLATQVRWIHGQVAVAAATLAAAALCNPLRRRGPRAVAPAVQPGQVRRRPDHYRVRGPAEGRRRARHGPRRPDRCRIPRPGTRPRIGLDQPA